MTSDYTRFPFVNVVNKLLLSESRAQQANPRRPELLARRPSDVIFRALCACIFIAAFLFQGQSQFNRIRDGNDPWLIGDWLISYAGGFVRRGFVGFVLSATTSTRATELLALWLLQTMLYAVIFGITLQWLLKLRSPITWAPVFLSPAFILFGTHDFQGSHRKEIIGLAGFFLLAKALSSKKFVRLYLYLALLLLLIGVLSHEINILIGMSYLGLLRWWMPESVGLDQACNSQRISRAIVVILTCGLVTALLFPGSVSHRDAICGDLQNRGYTLEVCAGAISWIGGTTGEAVEFVAGMGSRYLWFLFAGVLAIAPLSLIRWGSRDLHKLLFLVSPLFIMYPLGADWGRWIFVQVCVATVIGIEVSRRDNSTPKPLPVGFTLLFVTAWRLPHFGINGRFLGLNSFNRGLELFF